MFHECLKSGTVQYVVVLRSNGIPTSYMYFEFPSEFFGERLNFCCLCLVWGNCACSAWRDQEVVDYFLLFFFVALTWACPACTSWAPLLSGARLGHGQGHCGCVRGRRRPRPSADRRTAEDRPGPRLQRDGRQRAELAHLHIEVRVSEYFDLWSLNSFVSR